MENVTVDQLFMTGAQNLLGQTASREDVEALAKSLQAGAYQYATTLPASHTQGTVFQQESLEPALKVVTEIEKHVKLFNMIDKHKATQLVRTFDLQTDVGDSANPYMTETDFDPREVDGTFYREQARIKYYSVKKKITHVMLQIESAHGDIVVKYTKDGISYLLRHIEKDLFEGQGFFNNSGAYDGAVSTDSDHPAVKGLDKQLREGFDGTKFKNADFNGYVGDLTHIIDVDDVIQPENIEELATICGTDDGSPDMLMMSLKAHSDFSRQYYAKERTYLSKGDGEIDPGTIVPAMNTSIGKIKLVGCKFLEPKKDVRTVAAPDATVGTYTCQAPASVTAVDTNAASTDLEAGDYIYRATAFNQYGESQPATSAGITAAAGDRIQIQVADPAGGLVPYGFAIYRSDKDGAATTCKFVGYVKRAGATTNFIDLNYKKPWYSQAYMLENVSDSMSLGQLLPMTKVNLAQVSLYVHWAMVMYWNLIVFRPRRMGILENIQRA